MAGFATSPFMLGCREERAIHVRSFCAENRETDKEKKKPLPLPLPCNDPWRDTIVGGGKNTYRVHVVHVDLFLCDEVLRHVE